MRAAEILVVGASQAVVGGGYIGLEAATAARSAGKIVTVVEAAERLIPRAVAPVVSEFYPGGTPSARHSRAAVHSGLGPRGTAGRGSPRSTLLDGTTLLADLVVVGMGLVPHTELAGNWGWSATGASWSTAMPAPATPASWRLATALFGRIP